jgi:hypothetical protein
MIVAKQVADLITFARLAVAVFFIWLGIHDGSDALPIVVWLMLLDWIGDFLDGTLARRSRRKYQTWIGNHDLEVDMSVAAGLLLYLMASGLVHPLVGWIYLVIWGFIFLWLGIPPSLGMLFQAPVYGYLLWIALAFIPRHGFWLVAWIAAVVILTWPKFPRQVVPGFLYGFREIRIPTKRPPK